jgi:hypothetical protein
MTALLYRSSAMKSTSELWRVLLLALYVLPSHCQVSSTDLFTPCLFNDAVSYSDYTASNHPKARQHEREGMSKERAIA